MNLAPAVRFLLSFVILILAVGGGFFSSEPTSKTLLYGASLMLLLPISLVFLIDFARGMKFEALSGKNRIPRGSLSIPLGALALCAFAIGAYMLVSLMFGAGPIGWLSVVSGVLVAMMFFAFGFKLFRVIWRR